MPEPLQDQAAAAAKAPFERGTGQWEGVVMVERPDVSRLPAWVAPECRVMSARTVQLNGRRAIDCRLPYAMLAHYFRSGDGDHIFCEAEFKDGHLEVYGRARTNLKEWVIHSMVGAAAAGVDTGYH